MPPNATTGERRGPPRPSQPNGQRETTHQRCQTPPCGMVKINQGAARIPFTPVCSRAFRTTPVFFASATISMTLACAADDRPFGSISIVRSLVKAPGTIFAPERRFDSSSILLALAAQTSNWPLRSASIESTPRTSWADFNVRLRNWSDERVKPHPYLNSGSVDLSSIGKLASGRRNEPIFIQ